MSRIEAPKFYQRALYRLSQIVCHVPYSTIWRLDVKGSENVPKKGAALMASNHLSNADPPLIGSSIFRPIHYFAKEELFKIPVLGWIIAQINAFPVKRYEHDIRAFKKAQSLLESGEIVLLFPEGRRSKTGELGKPKPGAGMLAIKAQVPVIPVCIENSHRMAEFKQLKIRFGKPIFPKPETDDKSQYQAFSDEIMRAIADLKSKMYNEAS